ncbi:TMhelix containing protein [Vibrio phage 1.250.O._10N.261.55.E11]|nr:TMhelix containing protein [Vibrio phage 1.250.O._10N.261.55.E11]
MSTHSPSNKQVNILIAVALATVFGSGFAIGYLLC